jgi:hypothetical protein
MVERAGDDGRQVVLGGERPKPLADALKLSIRKQLVVKGARWKFHNPAVIRDVCKDEPCVPYANHSETATEITKGIEHTKSTKSNR